MTKKNRTGLQSEISHIFAGVPIPKKRHPRHEGPEPKPETKDQTQEIPTEQLPPEQPAQQSATEQVAAEASTRQPPIEQGQMEAAQVEQSTTEQASIEHLMSPQPQAEESKVEPQEVSATPFEEPIIVEIPSDEKQEIQPPVIEPITEQPAVPFSDTIEVSAIEEPAEAVKQPASVIPLKTRTAKERASAASGKASVLAKDSRFASKSSAAGSRKQKTMVILAIALSVLLVILLVKPFKKSSQNIIGQEPVASAGNNAKSDIERIKIDWTIPDIYPTEIRDPMKESSEQQFYSETGAPIVSGITYGVENKYAIMNTGAIVQEEDDIFGWKVLKINPNSVVFEKDGKTLELEPQGQR